ncbi:hypothetical protein [Bowmanella pacifica]|uniref:Uncharacterized protein n=1 Tax=Bowmanella pacifica TaxID=502051 RepID=A0A917YVU8_9ALTE|nr:hypothetical protein [Bowmanella pacifica]GGO67689.1 hypothetical protein GCM10010982_14750 [Bowmanella pacifica]
MSAYQSDTIKFRDRWYRLTDGGAFSPREHGIGPYDTDSYTPLGYSASFGVIDKHLYLLSLYTNHDADDFLLLQQAQADQAPGSPLSPEWDEPLDGLLSPNRRTQPPALNGVQASPMSDRFWFYAEVNLPLNYSGTLIIDSMPLITGDESEHAIREAIKDIVESGSHITRWTLQFAKGKLIAETAHEPDEQLAELIECYGAQNSLEPYAPAPLSLENKSGVNMDFSPAAPSTEFAVKGEALFEDFDIEPPPKKQ